MTLRTARATRPGTGRWLVVLTILIGFLGQIALQTDATPGATPRAALRHLTGIDIAAPAPMDAMPGMSGMRAMAAAMTHPGMPHHDHSHDDGGCPLCPLLHIAAFLTADGVAMPALSMIAYGIRARPGQPRAPPPALRDRP
ncbi:hypothetical protein, partial [Ameyamaea chiangmaiensis]